MKNYLKIISLGGFGNVTKNMYVYETEQDIIIVDCGVGFPEEEMLGVDLVIPDISYLLKRKEKIRAMFITHGHDDHIGAIPYILPKISEHLPIFAPRWAKALIEDKAKEFNLIPNVEEVGEGKRVKVGSFSIEFVKVTHSIPDTLHLVIETPVGRIYHAADFKLDLTPVIGVPANQEVIRKIGEKGVLCLLSDCLRSENPGFTPPEVKLNEDFEREISDTVGKFLFTTMSSNISRLKQAIDVSLDHNRKIVLVGQSVEKNVELAQKLGYFSYPKDTFIPKKIINRFLPSGLTLLVAGSQGQLGSAMERLVADEIEQVKLKPGDKVVFSSDIIPGNEVPIYSLIDDIYRTGASVAYSEASGPLHVSGHGSQGDLGKLMEMVKPKYLIPIGGNYRHFIAYRRLAERNNFKTDQVIILDGGQVVCFGENGGVNLKEKIQVGQVMVDALGVGDVGNVVLRDRQILAEEGVVVAILPIGQQEHKLQDDPEIISRGFVYIKENFDLLNQARDGVKKVLRHPAKMEHRLIRQLVQEFLERFFFEKTGRRPMVLVVIIEV